MPIIQSLINDLKTIEELHRRKNDDYANDSNPFLNFDQCTEILKWFKDPRDLVFVWPIANKLSRLANLLNSGKEPSNEAIEDSQLDIATYILLWRADIKRRAESNSVDPYVCNMCGNIQLSKTVTHHLFNDKKFVSELTFCSDNCGIRYLNNIDKGYEIYSIFNKKFLVGDSGELPS